MGELFPWLVVLALVIGFAWLCFSTPKDLSYLLEAATAAERNRDFDQAFRLYDQIESAVSGVEDELGRQQLRFIVAMGRANCLASQGFPEPAELQFRAAEELLPVAEQPPPVPISVFGGLAMAQLAQNKDADAALQRLRDCCEQLDEDEEIRTQAAERLLYNVVTTASLQCQYSLAMELAQLAIRMVEQTEPWHYGQLQEMQCFVGEICLLVGDYDEAERLTQLAISHSVPPDVAAVEKAHWVLGHLDLIAARFDGAEAHLREVIKVRELFHGDSDLQTLLARGALANVLRAHGDYQGALRFRDPADAQLRRDYPQDDLLVSESGLMLALLLSHVGDFERAAPLIRWGVETARQHGDQPLAMAQALLFKAICLHIQRDEGAASCAASARARAESVYGKGHVMLSEYLLTEAGTLVESEPQKARLVLADGMAAHRPHRQWNPLTQAELLMVQAELQLAGGDAATAAEQCARILASLEPLLLPSQSTLAEVNQVRAQALRQLRRADEAEQSWSQALEVRRMSQPDDHPAVQELLREAEAG